jgi:ribosomal protein S27AE
MIFNKDIKTKINEYLQKKLGMYDYSKGWLKGDCPSCGEHKFGVNLQQNRSNCFKCGYNPQPLFLILETEKLTTITEVKALLNNLQGLAYYEEEQVPFEIKKDNILPEGYHNIRSGDSRIAKSVRNYVIKRGFNVSELSLAGFGYCTKDKYFGYLIMPFYYDNLLVYFNARRFMGSGPKFNNPPIEDFGIGKSFIIYNRDALYLYDKIYLVESVTNARTLGDNSIGISGKVLSTYQLNDIIKSPCKKVVIGLDRDAIQYSIDIAYKLIDYKKVKVMVMPNEKDINDLGRKKSMLISRRSKYLDYQLLQKLKNKYIDEEKS